MSPPGSLHCLDDWLCWLETLSPNEIDLGLERTRDVLDRLELTLPARVITVGGTNGKGSSVAMLEGLLATTGERVGSYTSPHIHSFNERIRINGKSVSDDDIVAAFERIEAIRQGVPLTYFEFGTLAALVIFDTERPDTVILEVGLGGRLDAVNVVEPDACLITNVTLDHCDWLGNDVESIAAEKAGIMRGDTPVVFGSTTVPVAITTVASEVDAELILAGRDFNVTETSDGEWRWSGRHSSLDGLQKPSLEGQHQLQNAAAVLALIESLGLTDILQAPAINSVLATLQLAGRLQRICVMDQTFIVDVAHNTDSARVLRDAIDAMRNVDRVIVVIGVLKGKDLEGIIGALMPVVHRWIACTPDSVNAVSADALAQQVAQQSGKPCLIAGSVADALEAAQDAATPSDLIVITGSFYTVGPALDWLNDFRCAR